MASTSADSTGAKPAVPASSSSESTAVTTTADAPKANTAAATAGAADAAAGAAGAASPKALDRVITGAEVSKHAIRTDVWIIIHGRVYDITNWLDDHPGGEASLMAYAGGDATNAFEEVQHSGRARQLMTPFCIGKLAGYTGPDDAHLKPVPQAVATSDASCAVM